MAAQFARLRRFEVQGYPGADGMFRSVAGDAQLIATSFTALDRMTARERDNLRALVHAGATLYLRGAGAEGHRYSLAPIVDASFSAGRAQAASSYRFSRNVMIPAVLRDETAPLGTAINCASDLSGLAQPIVCAGHADGAESPIVFAYHAGAGTIICDTQPEETADLPLIWRLADPVRRCATISALIAVDRSSGRDMSKPPSFNLTIDDIPLGYDYFNESVLEQFLAHTESRCSGFHLDCAWIPVNRRMSRKYVDILKNHRTGFVRHGMYQHVDHQKIRNPAAQWELGKHAIDLIARRYDVELQPVIVFPYERSVRSVEELLLNEGFIAGVEQPRHDAGANEMLPEYLRYSAPACAHDSGLRFMHRYEAKFLTRERMLAIAALGMPILAVGHPKDVGLRRLSGLFERGGTFSHFDEVLDFAAAKGLRGRSLEEIARELFSEAADEDGVLACA